MTSRLTTSKLVLITDRRTPAPAGLAVPIKRYRIARLRIEGASAPAARLGNGHAT